MKLLILLSLLFPALSVAQKVEFIEPRTIQFYDEVDFTPIKSQDHLYLLMDKFMMMATINRNIQLDVYNSEYRNIASNLLEDRQLEIGDANIFRGFHLINDNLYLFKSHYVREGSKSALNYYPVSENAVRGDGVEIISFPAERMMNSGNFEVAVSDDGTKIAIFGEMPFERNENEKFKIWVFDQDFNQLWSKDFEFPYESVRGPRNEMMVNNDGSVYILKRIRVRREREFQTIFAFLNNGENVTESEIDIQNNLIISSYKHSFTNEGDLVMTGFYYSDQRIGINVTTPTGVFHLKFSGKDGSIATQNTIDIRGREFLTVNNVIHTKEGNTYLIGEQLIERRSPRTPATTPVQYDYDYTNRGIFVYYLDENGVLLWDQYIRREVKSKNDNAKQNHLFAWESNGSLNLLFRDLMYSYDGTNRRVLGPGQANIYACIIMKFDSENGEYNGRYLDDDRIGKRTGDYMFIPSSGLKIDENTIWMLAFRRDAGKSELVSTKIIF